LSGAPAFSVLVTAYNRSREIERCVRSAGAQTFPDFEIVVVDDGSTDDTAAVLAAIAEPRLRTIAHPVNRGISPARATTVSHARGEWLVMLDSDWELLPNSLKRLSEIIAGELQPGVRMIRSCLRWDNGMISPSVVPLGITDYTGRLQWLEAVWRSGGSSDAGHCVHRDVFAGTNYPTDRRGGIEVLWETNVARRERSLWVPDVLGLEHLDADNSTTRDVSPARLVPRLLAEAQDLRWLAETMLAEHGPALIEHAPTYHRWLLKSALTETLLCGDRRAGVRCFRAARDAGARERQLWATLAIGLLGPGLLARAKLARRRRLVTRSRVARAPA